MITGKDIFFFQRQIYFNGLDAGPVVDIVQLNTGVEILMIA